MMFKLQSVKTDTKKPKQMLLQLVNSYHKCKLKSMTLLSKPKSIIIINKFFKSLTLPISKHYKS